MRSPLLSPPTSYRAARPPSEAAAHTPRQIRRGYAPGTPCHRSNPLPSHLDIRTPPFPPAQVARQGIVRCRDKQSPAKGIHRPSDTPERWAVARLRATHLWCPTHAIAQTRPAHHHTCMPIGLTPLLRLWHVASLWPGTRAPCLSGAACRRCGAQGTPHSSRAGRRGLTLLKESDPVESPAMTQTRAPRNTATIHAPLPDPEHLPADLPVFHRPGRRFCRSFPSSPATRRAGRRGRPGRRMRGVGTMLFDLRAAWRYPVSATRARWLPYRTRRRVAVGASLSRSVILLAALILVMGGAGRSAGRPARLRQRGGAASHARSARCRSWRVKRAGIFVGRFSGLPGQYYGLESVFYAQAVMGSAPRR